MRNLNRLLYTTNQLNDIFILPDETDTIYSYNRPKKEVTPFYTLNFHSDFLTKDRVPEEDSEMGQIITESDNSLLLYITPDRLSEYGKEVSDKFGNTITGDMEDSPYILEFFE